MKTTVRIDGLKELDAALAQFTKATARNVLRRTLIKAAKPLVDTASRLAPVDTGELAGSIQASSNIENNVGKKEFAAVMASGGTTAEARAALRGARRAAGGQGSFAEVHVGPAKAASKKNAIKRIVQEFGSVSQPPQPYMRPAWAQEQNAVLDNIKTELRSEIDKTAKRAAARAAKLVAKA